MKAMFLAAFAAASLAAGAAAAKDVECKAEAVNEETGGEVHVTFTVTSKGKVKKREASWTPPSEEGVMGMLLNGAPRLSVEYDKPTDQGLGQASAINGFSMILTNYARVFDGAKMVFELPDARKWAVDMLIATGVDKDGKVSMVMGLGEFPARRFREMFADLDLLGRARLSVQRDGTVLKVATYDFSARAERDQLFARAWAAAGTAAQTPANCEKQD